MFHENCGVLVARAIKTNFAFTTFLQIPKAESIEMQAELNVLEIEDNVEECGVSSIAPFTIKLVNLIVAARYCALYIPLEANKSPN